MMSGYHSMVLVYLPTPSDLGMDDDDDEAIPLPNVNAAILRKVMNYRYFRLPRMALGVDRVGRSDRPPVNYCLNIHTYIRTLLVELSTIC